MQSNHFVIVLCVERKPEATGQARTLSKRRSMGQLFPRGEPLSAAAANDRSSVLTAALRSLPRQIAPQRNIGSNSVF